MAISKKLTEATTIQKRKPRWRKGKRATGSELL